MIYDMLATPRIKPSTEAPFVQTRTLLSKISWCRMPPNHSLRGHAHDTLHCCFVLAGSVDERGRRGWRRARAGTVRLSPPGDEHHMRFGPRGAICLILHLRPGAAAAWLQLPRDREFLASAPLYPVTDRIVERLTDAHASLMGECDVFEVLARLSHFRRRACVRTVPAWLEQVRDSIRPLGPAPTLRQLAETADRHPTHVARAYRRHFGLPIGEWTRRARVEAARQLVLGGETALLEIAQRVGFADQSHMTRMFRRYLGESPARLRKRCAAAAAAR